MNVLPGIEQTSSDVTSPRCVNCGAPLGVTEELRDSRGNLQTMSSIPSDCQNCGTDTSYLRTSPETLNEGGHESVKETLAKGDARFIVDHRRRRRFTHGAKSKRQSADQGSNCKAKDPVAAASEFDSVVDWRDDMDTFRVHMSRMEGEYEDLEGEDDDKPASRGHNIVFLTEPGASVEQIEEPPGVRRAWDDGVTAEAVITRDYEKDTNNWKTSYEIIAEDKDPESGMKVRVCRASRPGKKEDVTLSGPGGERCIRTSDQASSTFRPKVRSHSTPDMRWDVNTERERFIAIVRSKTDVSSASLSGNDGSTEEYFEEFFLRPVTPAPLRTSALSSDEASQSRSQNFVNRVFQ